MTSRAAAHRTRRSLPLLLAALAAIPACDVQPAPTEQPRPLPRAIDAPDDRDPVAVVGQGHAVPPGEGEVPPSSGEADPPAPVTPPFGPVVSTNEVDARRRSKASRNQKHSLFGRVTLPSSILVDGGGSVRVSHGGIIYNNGGGIIYNNGGGIIYNNGGGIIYNNGGGYRITAAAPVGGLRHALMYLTDRDERFFLDAAGEAFRTATDAAGAYLFPIEAEGGFPVGKDVVVNALIDLDYRLAGYIVPRFGVNMLRLDLPSTLGTEYLRGEAYRAGRSLGSYERNGFYRAVDLTQEAIDANEITAVVKARDVAGEVQDASAFDLRMSQVQTLRNQYVVAISAVDKAKAAVKAVSDQWKALLGYRPAAVTTVMGNGGVPSVVSAATPAQAAANLARLGFAEGDWRDGASPAATAIPAGFTLGVAVSKRGDVFVASRAFTVPSGHIRWLKPNGEVRSIWLPNYPFADPRGIAIEREPVDSPDDAHPPGTLLVTDIGLRKVYRVPIVDRPIYDATGVRPRWPMEIVTGEDRPFFGPAGRPLDPFHPVFIDGEAAVAKADGLTPATSRWRLADDGPRTYVRGNMDEASMPGPGGEPVPVPPQWKAPAGAPVPNSARYAHVGEPIAVTTDELGNIYVADFENHRIRMIAGAAAAGRTLYGYRRPLDGDGDNVIDGYGDPVPAHPGSIYTIAGDPRWRPELTPRFTSGHWFGEFADSDTAPAQRARLDRPISLAFRDGWLYVCDLDNQRIRRISRETGLIETFAGNPAGGQVAFGDDYAYRFGIAGDGGPARQAKLAHPSSMAFDRAGSLFVWDASGRLRMIDPGGTIRTVAGRLRNPLVANAGRIGDGDALTWADLGQVYGIGADPDGNIVFSDLQQRRVRKLWRQWEQETMP